MIWCWAFAMFVFLAIEAVTTALCSIWFAAGSFAAMISAICKAPIWLQTVLFAVVSILCLVLIYPKAKKMLEKGHHATNADRLICMDAVVVQPIDNIAGSGAVLVDGKRWSAKSSDGVGIDAGNIVQIQKIEGAKLIVAVKKEA